MIRLLGGVRGLSQEQEPLGQDTSQRGVRSPSGLTGHPPNQRRPRLPSRAHLLPPPYAHTHSPSLLTWIPDVFQVRNKVAEISVFSIIVDLQEKHRAVKPTGDETSGTVPMKPSVWCSERLGRAKGARGGHSPCPRCAERAIWLFSATGRLGSPVSSRQARSEAFGQLLGDR